ncbi:hypothetical protein TNCV_3492961 [Trichonephila clavipes]|nr:hypothetical protein TNCV_3492961 [Trichonephila clavipes]
MQVTVRFCSVPPQFRGRKPWGWSGAIHLSSSSTNHTREHAARRLFRVAPCHKGTIHLQTSMSSPGFEPSPYGTTALNGSRRGLRVAIALPRISQAFSRAGTSDSQSSLYRPTGVYDDLQGVHVRKKATQQKRIEAKNAVAPANLHRSTFTKRVCSGADCIQSGITRTDMELFLAMSTALNRVTMVLQNRLQISQITIGYSPDCLLSRSSIHKSCVISFDEDCSFRFSFQTFLQHSGTLIRLYALLCRPFFLSYP